MEGEGDEQRTDMSVIRTDLMAETGGFQHRGLADSLTIHRHLVGFGIKLDGAQVRTLDRTVVAHPSHVRTFLTGPVASGGVEFITHLLSGVFAFVVGLVKGNLQIYGIPGADGGLAPSDGVQRTCGSGLGDRGGDVLDGQLDGVVLASALLLFLCLLLTILLVLVLVGLQSNGLTRLTCQLPKSELCFSGCAECKHGCEGHHN